MGAPFRRGWLIAVMAWLGGIPSGAADELLWNRAEVLEQIAGVVEVRGPVQSRLELPDALCADGAFACPADRVYRFVLGLRFVQEVDRAGSDGEASRELVERGELLVALDLEPDDEFALRERLDGRLAGLTASEFARPRAGLGFLADPFEIDLVRRTLLPGWFCRAGRNAPAAVDVIATRPGAPGETTWGRAGEIAARGCGQIAAALAGVTPRIVRTLPNAGRLRRIEVRLVRGSTLEAATWADALRVQDLGDTVRFRKRALDDRLTGSIRDWRDGVFRGHEGRVGGVERSVLLGPENLDLAGRPAWGARFVFVERTERFGEEPALSPPLQRELAVGVVPIRDPLMPDEAAGRTPLAVPEDALIDRVLETLEASAAPGPDDVVEALADPHAWPSTGDWLVVLCPEDGRATWGIAPFVNRIAEVTNAAAACDAIELVIGER
ncbi:MAG: hypothetical protein D6738_09660 [Acidobacteria bacterium]|nr:MAG: hypothetical protein D6738_09660 [Acidobacteriota bacterium]